MENPPIPEFIDPQPGRMQEFAMRAAGLLMRQDTPRGTLESLATDVGGYEAKADPSGQTHYTRDVEPVLAMSLGDETTAPRLQQKYKSGADFEDATGTHLEMAAARTLSKQRKEGPRAQTIRGRAARRLAGYATKGVGVYPYLKS